MEHCNVFVGRFQPLTVGHMKCIITSYTENRLKTVLFMIDVPSEKVDEKHPFPSDMLIDMYKTVVDRSEYLIDIIRIKSADILKISEECNRLGYRIASWTCGTDRQESYGKMIDKYKDKANLTPTVKLVVLDRLDGVSATMIRDAIYNKDIDTFANNTPFGYNELIFNSLYEQLIRVLK